MMPSNKSIKTELNFYGPSPRVRDLVAVDTIANKFKCQIVVTEPAFFDQLFMVKNQRQSGYAIFVMVDKDAKTFGMNKMYSVPNVNSVDGLEIMLTKGRSKNELLNEINSIAQFLKMSQRLIPVRWGILVTAGDEHIANCVAAIKDANVKNKNDSAVKLVFKPKTDAALVQSVIASVRTGLGQEKAKIKINIGSESEIGEDSNITYDVDASVLL